MTYIPDALRKLVVIRAKNCCEYCLLAQANKSITFEIDHIIPEKHRGATDEANLCLACFDCNRNKGSDFASFDPVTDQIAPLFNPRRQLWVDHFKLENSLIKPLTPQGRVTVFVLQLNESFRVEERAALTESGLYPPHIP